MDISIFRSINNLAGQFFLIDFLGKFLAVGLLWVIGFFLLILAFKKQINLPAAFLSVLLAYGLNSLIGFLLFRPRPFVTLLDTHLLIVKEATEKSFPSNHAALAFALAMSVYLINKKWGWFFLILAGLVGWGRIFVGVHYPSDILAGLGVGILSVLLIRRLKRA